MSFQLGNVSGRAVLIDGEHYFDVEALSGGRFGPDPMAAIGRFGELAELDAACSSGDPTGRVADVTLDPPVPRPQTVLGIGLNYRDHVEETGRELPTEPVVFPKFRPALCGSTAEVRLAGDAVDFEAELVVVIGAPASAVSRDDAWGYVAGLMAGQDISDRALQFAAAPAQFGLGKSRPTYAPTGPFVASVDSFDDPDDIEVGCTVNGEQRQSSRTSQLIFDVPFLIEYLTAVMPLAPGDLIFTGTPGGVGAVDGRFLRPGDVIDTTVGPHHRLRNRCVA